MQLVGLNMVQGEVPAPQWTAWTWPRAQHYMVRDLPPCLVEHMAHLISSLLSPVWKRGMRWDFGFQPGSLGGLEGVEGALHI